MFQKIAKAGSRKCTSWHAELLGRNVAPLHLAREREMKAFLDAPAAFWRW